MNAVAIKVDDEAGLGRSRERRREQQAGACEHEIRHNTAVKARISLFASIARGRGEARSGGMSEARLRVVSVHG